MVKKGPFFWSWSLVYFTPCQRKVSEKLEDYASYLLIAEEETFDSNWIVEDNESGFHISLHYKGDNLNKHRIRRKEEGGSSSKVDGKALRSLFHIWKVPVA